MHSVLAVPVRLDVHGVLGVPGCLVCFQSLCAWCALCASCVPCVLVNSGVPGVHVVSVLIGVLGLHCEPRVLCLPSHAPTPVCENCKYWQRLQAPPRKFVKWLETIALVH